MGENSTYSDLVRLLISSPFMESQDRLVVKGVVYKLNLDSTNLEDINDKIKGQVELEAKVSYLLGVYRTKVNELQFDLEEEESAKQQELPDKDIGGYRITDKEKKARIAVDPDVALLRRRVASLQSLYQDLQNLYRIVFNRNEKLTNLCVNYRRELKVDSEA